MSKRRLHMQRKKPGQLTRFQQEALNRGIAPGEYNEIQVYHMVDEAVTNRDVLWAGRLFNDLAPMIEAMLVMEKQIDSIDKLALVLSGDELRQHITEKDAGELAAAFTELEIYARRCQTPDQAILEQFDRVQSRCKGIEKLHARDTDRDNGEALRQCALAANEDASNSIVHMWRAALPKVGGRPEGVDATTRILGSRGRVLFDQGMSYADACIVILNDLKDAPDGSDEATARQKLESRDYGQKRANYLKEAVSRFNKYRG